jgi:hypothetical protein
MKNQKILEIYICVYIAIPGYFDFTYFNSVHLISGSKQSKPTITNIKVSHGEKKDEL